MQSPVPVVLFCLVAVALALATLDDRVDENDQSFDEKENRKLSPIPLPGCPGKQCCSGIQCGLSSDNSGSCQQLRCSKGQTEDPIGTGQCRRNGGSCYCCVDDKKCNPKQKCGRSMKYPGFCQQKKCSEDEVVDFYGTAQCRRNGGNCYCCVKKSPTICDRIQKCASSKYNVGYCQYKCNRYQVIDKPGTVNCKKNGGKCQVCCLNTFLQEYEEK